MQLHLTRVALPMGEILLATDSLGVVWLLTFASDGGRLLQNLLDRYGDVVFDEGETAASLALAEKIARYYEGEISILDNIPVVEHGNALKSRLSAALHEKGDDRAIGHERARLEQIRCFIG